MRSISRKTKACNPHVPGNPHDQELLRHWRIPSITGVCGRIAMPIQVE
jgi:hypothetical protein